MCAVLGDRGTSRAPILRGVAQADNMNLLCAAIGLAFAFSPDAVTSTVAGQYPPG